MSEFDPVRMIANVRLPSTAAEIPRTTLWVSACVSKRFGNDLHRIRIDYISDPVFSHDMHDMSVFFQHTLNFAHPGNCLKRVIA
jgi:hypothetical protein